MDTNLKTIVKTIVCCVVVGLFLFSQGERVWASNNVKLYVDAAASPGGNGSNHAPYRRITDAVNTARVIWQADNTAKIEIRVEPGTYAGSYSNTNPNKENLPIVLDIPDLKLKGSTSLLIDAGGLPTGEFEPGKNTLLIAQPPLAANQSLVIIAPTSPVLTGRGVEVSKFSFNLGNITTPSPGSSGISARGVQGFTIRNNHATGGGVGGIDTRGSSGEIRGNYATMVSCGICVGAGNASSPANVIVRGNRSVNNQNAGVILHGGNSFPGEVFDKLSAVVEGNDFSDSNTNPMLAVGVRVLVSKHEPPSTATFGSVTATISNNRISNNSFGFTIAAGFPYRTFAGAPDPRLFNGTLDLTLEDNEVVGNVLAPALISFTRSSTTITPSELAQWKYLEHSTYNIADPDGELTGYWFDHPVTDPIDGRTLYNVLRINGAVIPNGRYVPFH